LTFCAFRGILDTNKFDYACSSKKLWLLFYATSFFLSVSRSDCRLVSNTRTVELQLGCTFFSKTISNIRLHYPTTNPALCQY